MPEKVETLRIRVNVFAKCTAKLYLARAMRPRRKKAFHYILFNKPFGVLSQFTPEAGRASLKGFGPFPGDTYAAGRLDAESEGLLLLTNDNSIKHRLTEPGYRHPRTYLVQVERIPGTEALQQLRDGVTFDGRRTRPSEVRLLDQEPELPARPIPIRFRKQVPTAWLEITLHEGRTHQVRRMTAVVGHPTLRLVRIRMGTLGLEGLAPGQSRMLSEKEIRELKAVLGT